MAVASYQRPGETIGPKAFPPPKTSSVMHWYRAACKVIPQLPHWTTLGRLNASVDVEALVFELPEGTLFIARKKDLR